MPASSRRTARRTHPLLAAGIALALLLAPSSGRPLEAQVDLPRGPWVPSWEVLYGGFRQLDDLHVDEPGAAWGLDRNAFVDGRETRAQSSFVRWEGGLWRTVQIVNDVDMSQLDIVGRTGFAVGSGGAIYRLVGTRWLRYPSPTGNDLASLDLVSRAEGWASGARGTVLRWDGALWLPTPLPEHLRLVDVPAIAGDGRGGAYALAGNGEVLRYEGGLWRVLEGAPRILRPRAIGFSPAGHGIFAGNGAWELADGRWEQISEEGVNHLDLVWDGEVAYVLVVDTVYRYAYAEREWGFAALPQDLRFTGLAPAPEGILAIGARGEVFELKAGQSRYLWPAADPLEALDAVSEELAWAGGFAVDAAMVGSDDGRWTLRQEADFGTRVIDLDLASAADGWAIGSEPGARQGDPTAARVWRWDGQAWRDWEVEKTWNLYEVQALNEDEAWASGSNVVARWDGSDWLQVEEAPFTARFAALSMLRGGESPEGWFGAEGEIYHMQGTTWTAQPIGEGFWVPRLVLSSASEGWAIARHRAGVEPDRLLRFDGQTWTPVELPIEAPLGLLDVDAPVPGTAWVLVDANGLLHWTGSAWEYHVLAPLGESIEPLRVRALKLEPDKRDITVWLAGRRPSVARYRVVEPRETIYLPVSGQSWIR